MQTALAATTTTAEPQDRIVLLFDLDSFYASCERVRLGLDPNVPLALIQWNSALAVSYPAREFGIKRGDSFETIATKSNNTCWSIHLPIITKESNKGSVEGSQNNNDDDDDEDDGDNILDIRHAYEKEYNLTREQQLECQRKERNLRRSQSDGIACLERYRLASMRIFQKVTESLQSRLGDDNKLFVLERASIDEFYLDITNYCKQQLTKQQQQPVHPSIDHETVLFNGPNNVSNEKFHINFQSSDLISAANMGYYSDKSLLAMMEMACQVAKWIRTDIHNELGFTMSAGISVNKTIAKLAASYGKPNGQAIILPHYVSTVLDITKISKVRHFGGKVGKQLQQLLSSRCPNHDMDSLTLGQAKCLSMPDLVRHFKSEETAKFIFDACRGIDREMVKEKTQGTLVKSITAFKSFPSTTNLNVITDKWLAIIATEIISRVKIDSKRNSRYPKTCTLSILMTPPPNVSRRVQNKSIRVLFPPEVYAKDKVQYLLTHAKQTLLSFISSNSKSIPPIRGIGLSTSNFQAKGSAGTIEKFFANHNKKDCQLKKSSSSSTLLISSPPPTSPTRPQQNKELKNDTNSMIDLTASTFSTTTTTPTKSRPLRETTSPLTTYFSRNNPVSSLSAKKELQTETSSQQFTSNQQNSTNSPNKNTMIDPNAKLPLEKHISSNDNNNDNTLASKRKHNDRIVASNSDLELAKKLQASYDRETYILSQVQGRLSKQRKQHHPRRIDSFFQKQS